MTGASGHKYHVLLKQVPCISVEQGFPFTRNNKEDSIHRIANFVCNFVSGRNSDEFQ